MILDFLRRQVFARWFELTIAILGCVSASAAAANLGDQLLKLTPSDPAAYNGFGTAVAINGHLGLVGTPYDASLAQAGGSAYVFDLRTGQQLQKLAASDAAGGDFFGRAVAIGNNTAIIGAYSDNDGGNGSGSAYLFDPITGEQLFKLVASDAEALDVFGVSVAIDGDVALVGAPGNSGAGDRAGAAYLFDVTTGRQRLKLIASDAATYDEFGQSVALSGNFAVVGSPGDVDAGYGTGSAYVFDVTTGEGLLKLSALDASQSFFGHAVAISGNTAIVGAHLKNDVAVGSGAAYLFDITTGEQLHKLVSPEAVGKNHFGYSVAINGNIAIVGTDRDFYGPHPDRGLPGLVYVFDVDTGRHLVSITGSDSVVLDFFGSSVALDGPIGLVGSSRATNPFTASGATYVFFIVPEPSADSMVFLGVMLQPFALCRCPRRAPCLAHRR